MRPAVFRVLVAVAILGLGATLGLTTTFDDPKKPADKDKPTPAPEITGGVAWLNTAGPIKLADLKGKFVLLDFWTLCCINCIHTLPDLSKLEKKFANELVVIGVHSAKFESEKDTKNIRKAILRYEIAHPVVNDADHKIWDRFGVSSWPTLVLIDPEGNLVGAASGEGNYEILDKVLTKLIAEHKEKKTLDEKPRRFDLVRYREQGDTPLFFPGKILADETSKRLFIADSTHHRIVVTDLDGKSLFNVGNAVPGFKDGNFETAQFDDPQGMALKGDILFVADRKNHSIRKVDLKSKTVTTFAGTGKQDGEFANRGLSKPVGVKTIGLNSPWDLLIQGDTLYVAMAGHHQIWSMDLTKNEMVPFAGNGQENIRDGPHYSAKLAQPSGLTTDGTFLYVADSEVSAVRRVPLNGEGRVSTLVGMGLFEFGDIDGVGDEARLQHALGVAHHEGLVYVADTYNNKIKTIDPKTRICRTFVAGEEPGPDGKKVPLFEEPAGISIAAGKIFLADTNNHRIRVVDLKTKSVSTLVLKGVVAPPVPKEWQPPKE
jgi:thiol-disulfide isomerase/thioredoxin